MTGELRALTGARGLAAWFVVLYHIRGSIAGLPGWAEAVLARGYLAVDFFFLLSGFVIALAWGDRLRERGVAAVPGFLRRRVARIWPLHLFMLSVAAVLATLFAAGGRADPVRFPWPELPLHLLLVQNWGTTERLAWNDPAWSISAEAAAYLLFPLTVFAPFLILPRQGEGDQRSWWRGTPALKSVSPPPPSRFARHFSLTGQDRNGSATTTTALVASVAVPLLLLAALMHGQPTLGTDIPGLGLPRCLAEFAAGTALYACWRRGIGTVTRWATLSAMFTIAWATGAPETLVAPAALAALLLALAHSAGRPGHPLEGHLIHQVGEISYATYLSHFLLWTLFKLAFVTDPNAVPPRLIALYLLIVLAASAALYRFVERPGQRLLAPPGIARVRPAPRPALPPAPR